ncbi:MAG: YqeG family HAD IIIA-type phosphatase [Deinococcales bacterium]
MMQLLRPGFYVGQAFEIDEGMLTALKIKALCIDLDDTLMATGSCDIAEGYLRWLSNLKTQGFKMMICSNGTKARVARSAAILELEALAKAGKPSPYAFWQVFKHLGSSAQETLVIGDQLFTDILGAHLVGAPSALVTPLSPGRWHTRVIRKLEHHILKNEARSFK